MCKKQLFGRLWRISEGEIEDGDERLFRILQLARSAVAEGIESDPLNYLMEQLAWRVYEDEAPGWLARGFFSVWVLVGKLNAQGVVKALDVLLDDLGQELALT